MHYVIDNDAGVFAVEVEVSNGIDATGVAYEAWWFSVPEAADTPQRGQGRGVIVRDPVRGSASDREDAAVRAAGLCLAADPSALEALVCFRDDPAGYQGMFSLDPQQPTSRIPMTDTDVRHLLGHIPPTRAGQPWPSRGPLSPPESRREASWNRPASRYSSSRTSPNSLA
jgi:hypothetical protein